MSTPSRAAELREAFDQSFARPPAEGRAPGEKLLRVAVGELSLAVRLREISGVHVDRRIVPCPGGVSGFLGIAGVRGRPIPVYSIAVLLGEATAAAAPRWILLAKPRREDAALGFAFDALEGYIDAAPADFMAEAPGGTGGEAREAVRVADGFCAVLELQSLIEMCEARAASK